MPRGKQFKRPPLTTEQEKWIKKDLARLTREAEEVSKEIETNKLDQPHWKGPYDLEPKRPLDSRSIDVLLNTRTEIEFLKTLLSGAPIRKDTLANSLTLEAALEIAKKYDIEVTPRTTPTSPDRTPPQSPGTPNAQKERG